MMAWLKLVVCVLVLGCPTLTVTVPPAKDPQYQERLENEKSKTTFVVPRSNAIQIAFGGASDDPQTSLHVDLLKLYKEVMEEILQRNKLISTVQLLLEKVPLIDDLIVRVRTLEDIIGKDVIVAHRNRKPIKGKVRQPKGPGKDDRTEQNNTLDYDPPPPLSSKPPGDVAQADWDMLVREVQRQRAEINAMREHQTEVTSQYNDVMAHVRTIKASVDSLNTEMKDRRAEGELCRAQNLAQAEMLESHTTELHVHKSSLEVLEAKVHKLTLDVQWQSFKINMHENTTENVKSGLHNLESFLGTTAGAAGSRGADMFSMWSRAKADIERCQGDVNILQKKMRHMEDDLQTVSSQLSWMRVNFNGSARQGHNETYWQSLIEDTASRVYNMLHGLNVSQRHMSSLYASQQKQLDNLSLDVERMKDQLENYNERLTDISRHLEYLKDYNLHGRRDRERIKRKMEKIQRDMRTVFQGYDGGTEFAGMTFLTGNKMRKANKEKNDDEEDDVSTTESEPRSVQKRTTVRRNANVTPTARDTTLPGTTRHGDVPHTVAMVTGGPEVGHAEARKGSAEYYDYDDDMLEIPDERAPDYDELAKETLSSLPHNCSIRGFGGRRMVRTFRRVLTGAWMRDPADRDSHVYVLRNNAKVNRIKEFESEEHLINNTLLAVHHLPFKCAGTGHVIFHNKLVCNRFKTNKVVSYDLETKETTTMRLPQAGYNNTFPYASGVTDIDLAIDELGLWVIFASQVHDGNIMIGRVDDRRLTLTRVWITQFPKERASNTFMICGKLYVTRYEPSKPLRIAYVFDTVTGKQLHAPDVTFVTDPSDFQTSLDYNPSDHRLYAWVVSDRNYDGHLVTYDVQFGS